MRDLLSLSFVWPTRLPQLACAVLAGGLLLASEPAMAAAPDPGPVAQAAPAARAGDEGDVVKWLIRGHEASRKRSYVGTLVVLSANGGMSSSRIWHVCEGNQQAERVESLTGTPRSTFRRNDEVMTFLPELRLARSERRDSFGLFPNLLRVGEASVAGLYSARVLGGQRVAGLDTDVVQVVPKDGMRYGYRLWTEKKSGLVVQLQTLAADGRVLEQAAFSELDMGAPLRMDQLVRMMNNTAGYKVERLEVTKTTGADEGWSLKDPIPGFQPVSCYRRTAPSVSRTVHWIFSDGLATVSLFIEPYGPQPRQESQVAVGVTQMLSQRIAGDWWLTAVGEVPVATLQAFAQSLERRP